jgi:nucleoid DNA-binding protein
MNKMELIKTLSKETAISKSEATTVLDIFFNRCPDSNGTKKGGKELYNH